MQTRTTVALLSAALFGASAAAQDAVDWIDEFPSATEVARAAFEEHQVTAARTNVDGNDADGIAINLAGTFVMLRQILWLKQREDGAMTAARTEKLRELVASYQEAELAIGAGRDGRNGYIRRTDGEDCGADDECYQRWWLLHLNASSGRAEYRERVLKRLFPCGTLARELDDLRQQAANRGTLSYFPSPSATLEIEDDYAGLATAGCGPHGGDTDNDGLCDAWEAVPATRRAEARRANATADEPQPCIELIRVLMADTGGLKVGIAATSNVKPNDYVEFRVSRSALDTDTQGQFVWQGMGKICERGRISDGCPGMRPPAVPRSRDPREALAEPGWPPNLPGLYEALTATGPDPRAPQNWPLYAVIAADAPLAAPTPSAQSPESAPLFLTVDTTTVPSRRPVQCEQPSRVWLNRHYKPPKGLHGPYVDLDDAFRRDEAGNIAWQLYGDVGVIDNREFGYLILAKAHGIADPRGLLYTTAPGANNSWTSPDFDAEDYYATWTNAFESSCEDATDFVPAATVHTHPGSFASPYTFSVKDFDGAIESKLLIAMIDARDLCIRTFQPLPSDETLSWWETRFLASKAYDDYRRRVTIIPPQYVDPARGRGPCVVDRVDPP
jgi:hypothetical protein